MQIDKELDASVRRDAFLADLVSICRKHRVLMDEPDWDLVDIADTITLREYPEARDCSFTVDAGDIERVLREALWDEIHVR